MRLGALAGLALLATVLPSLAFDRPNAQNRPLNTLADVGKALRSCWRWPPLSEARSAMELTILVSFKSDGEMFGARITYQTPNVSEEERGLYYGALLTMLARCSPLPVSKSLGAAIAGRPLRFHIHDTRKQRKA